jgi:hypothetical protein
MTRLAVLAALIAFGLAAAVSAAQEPDVRRPRSGSVYHGAAHHVDLQISGRAIGIMAFSFRCDGTKGRISLNDLRLKRTTRGYRLRTVIFGLVTYRDGEPDENAEVRLRGLFTRDAHAVRGRFRVIAPRCDTGRRRWRAVRTTG